MYWAHKREDTKTYLIESSSLDGWNREIILNSTESARSLSIDFSTDRLYFVYVESGKIVYYDLKTHLVSLKI